MSDMQSKFFIQDGDIRWLRPVEGGWEEEWIQPPMPAIQLMPAPESYFVVVRCVGGIWLLRLDPHDEKADRFECLRHL